MTKSRYLSILTAAALVGTVPAWAQTPSAHTIAPKPLCSELGHPNAGKLADKSTGMAKEKSASAVHADCTPDPRVARPAPETTTASPSVTGSSTSQGASITGSSTDVNTSVTGSTSTVSPNIDLRGRSSVTIDNATTTGTQSVDTTATTTTSKPSSKK